MTDDVTSGDVRRTCSDAATSAVSRWARRRSSARCGAKQRRGMHYASRSRHACPSAIPHPRHEAPVTPQPEAAQSAADHHRRQPPQARLARAAQPALGAVAARRRAARRGQARRRAPRARRAAPRRHRHRLGRRADAPALRHHVHRGAGGSRFRAQEDRAHPPALRRRRAGSGRPGGAHAPDLRRGRAIPALADLAAGQVHASRPDDDGGHALRRPLQEPGEARAWSSRRYSTPRRARWTPPAST